MNWTRLALQLASQLGAALVERIATTVGETLIKVPGADASPRGIATATKSAVSADREGKIASAQARQKRDTWRNPPSIYEDKEKE